MISRGGPPDAGSSTDGGSDAHAGPPTDGGASDAGDAGDGDATVSSVPSGCTAGASLTAQQKALEFLFFDVSGCVSDDAFAPPPLPAPGP